MNERITPTAGSEELRNLSQAQNIFCILGAAMIAWIPLFAVTTWILLQSFRLLPAGISDSYWYNESAALLISYLPGAICCCFLMKKLPIHKPTGIFGFGAKQMIAAQITELGLMYFTSLFGNLLLQKIGLIDGSSSSEGTSVIVVDFILLVIFAPVCEEYLFRRLTLGRLLFLGEGSAILVSSLFFALAHGSFSKVLYTFAAGLVFGYVYIMTGHLRFSILIHMISNLMTALFGWLPDGGVKTVFTVIIVFGSMIFALNILIRKKPWRALSAESPCGLTTGQKLQASARSVTFWIAIALFVIGLTIMRFVYSI